MVIQTGKIEKYVGSNVYFVGKEKPLFIPPEDIKAAMTNYPVGKVVTYKTKDKQKGTLEGMAEPTANEMKSYQQDQKAAVAAGQKPSEFEPASNLPRDPEAEKQRAAEALQQNLKDKIAEGAGCTPHQEPVCTTSPAPSTRPACFKSALCPKICDGTKDPCQFKPKAKPAEPPKQPAVSSGPTNPSSGTETAQKPAPAPAQGHSGETESFHEALTNIANMDPRLLEHLKEHEPELMKAFTDKMKSLLHEVKDRQKGPVERGQFPTPDELLGMVYNYDTYWKAKTILDLMAAKRIANQVEFKNRLECVSLALSTKPADRETCYRQAWDIYDTITQKINEVTKDA